MIGYPDLKVSVCRDPYHQNRMGYPSSRKCTPSWRQGELIKRDKENEGYTYGSKLDRGKDLSPLHFGRPCSGTLRYLRIKCFFGSTHFYLHNLGTLPTPLRGSRPFFLHCYCLHCSHSQWQVAAHSARCSAAASMVAAVAVEGVGREDQSETMQRRCVHMGGSLAWR